MAFISIIVGFRNRETQRVGLFIESLARQSDKNFELVFVDFGSEPDLAETTKQLVAKHAFAFYHYVDTRGQHWNRSRCLNIGLKKCKGDLIFTADIDFVFHPDFIITCYAQSVKQQTTFFRVGYLNEKDSASVTEFTSLKSESYSDENAIGPLLILKSKLEAVGNYDEFFEIWGLEDNDLKYRLEQNGTALSFYSKKIFIWHVWHPPVKSAGQLPSGWLSLLSDYFLSKKRSKEPSVYLHLDPERPALAILNGAKAKVLEPRCKKHFLQMLLHKELRSLHSGQGLRIEFNFSEEENIQLRPINKVLKNFNRFAASQGWPLQMKNKNMEAYLSKQEAWETLVYFIKLNTELISDYFLTADLDKQPAILVKR